MSVLLGLVPWWARIAAVLALVGSVFGYGYGYGYVKGLHHGELRLDAFTARQSALAAQADAANARLSSIWREKLQEKSDAYDKDVAAWRARFLAATAARGLRDTGTGFGSLPAVPTGAGEIQGRPADVVSVAAYRTLQEQCGETTLMFLDLRESWEVLVAAQTESR
jgi:hypothetical protein